MLRNCTMEVLDKISDHKLHYTIRKGDDIIREGEPNRGIFFIQSGIAKVTLCSNGKPLLMRLAYPGCLLGQRSNDNHTYYSYSAVALEDTSVCLLQQHYYNVLVQEYPSFYSEIVNSFLEELLLMEQRAGILAYKTVKQKVADALIRMAHAYQYQFNASGIHIHLDRQDLAELACTTREQVSAVLIALKAEGIINFRAKHFKYLDLAALQKIVGAK